MSFHVIIETNRIKKSGLHIESNGVAHIIAHFIVRKRGLYFSLEDVILQYFIVSEVFIVRKRDLHYL